MLLCYLMNRVMKSKRAEEFINNSSELIDGLEWMVDASTARRAVDLAEQDAEEEIEKVKARAVEAFCTACRHNHNGECRAFVVGYQDDILHESCANVLSWENGHLFCESGYHKFIQKLNEK